MPEQLVPSLAAYRKDADLVPPDLDEPVEEEEVDVGDHFITKELLMMAVRRLRDLIRNEIENVIERLASVEGAVQALPELFAKMKITVTMPPREVTKTIVYDQNARPVEIRQVESEKESVETEPQPAQMEKNANEHDQEDVL